MCMIIIDITYLLMGGAFLNSILELFKKALKKYIKIKRKNNK